MGDPTASNGLLQRSTAKGLIALPVGVYEISLAFWLIVKGFDQQSVEKLKANESIY